MSLSPVSSRNSDVSKFSSFGQPLLVRMFGEEILEIFLDRTAFLFGILSNPEERTSRKKVTFLPLRPVLPEQIRALQKLLSPEMSFLRLKNSNVIQIEPKLLGGGIEKEIDPKIKTARALFLKLSELNKEDLVEINQGELFDKIGDLSKALPSLSNYKYSLSDAWYVAKVLHMAIDILLLTIWDRERDDDQNTRYSFEQKKAVLKPIRNAKKILERHAFPMKEATLLSLDLTETGVQLLPELDMKPKDWKAFIHIGGAVNTSFAATNSIESDNSQQVSKLLTDLWFSLGGHWTVSPNLYGYSILARFLLLNENFQVSALTSLLKCLSIEETFSLKESEENPDSISRHLLAFDRLTNLSLYKPKEDLREQAFYEICPWTKSKNETLRKSAILSLTQASLLSQDSLIKKKASEVLDALGLSQEEGLFLFSYQKWVTDNLPRGHLDEENLKIEQAFETVEDRRSLDIIKQLSFCSVEEPIPLISPEEDLKIEQVLEMARNQGSLDVIKWLSFCAVEESIPPPFLEDGFDSFESTLQKMVNLGLVEENGGAYKISKKTQDRLKKLISKEDGSDEKTLLSSARSLNRLWNFDETNLDSLVDQQENIPLHIQSFLENILKDDKTSDPLVIASIVFLHKLGLYHLLVKKDLLKALANFKKALDRFAFLSPEAEEEASPDFALPKKQDIRFLFDICRYLDRSESELNFLDQRLDLREVRFLSTLIKTFSNISSLAITVSFLRVEDMEALASGIKGSKLLNLRLQSSLILAESFKALAAALPSFQLTNLSLYQNNIGDEGAKALAVSLHKSQITDLNLQDNRIGTKGAEALAATLPKSNLTNLYLQYNKIGDGGARALAASLPKSKLTNLNLEDNHITGEGAFILAAALSKSQLTNLNLHRNCIGDEGAKVLADTLPKSNLTNLYLQSNKIGDRGAGALAASLPSSKVTYLDLGENRIRDEGATALAASLPSSKLTYLHLKGNEICSEGAKAFAATLSSSKLTYLELHWWRDVWFGAEVATALAAVLPSSQLTHLNLEKSQIGNEGASVLAAALSKSQLTNLILNGNSISAEGVKTLARALPKSQLTDLDLQWNQIGDEGTKALTAALPSSKLTNLNLSSNQISDEEAKALAAAISSSKITNLDLSRNKIGAEGATALAAALPSSKLTNLNLSCNQISDEGAKALAAAISSSKITNLDLSLNRIGAEGAKALDAALLSSKITSLNLNSQLNQLLKPLA